MFSFIMYQYEIGGVESVFAELAKCSQKKITLFTVIPQYNKELIEALSDGVTYIPHDKIPILNKLYWLYNSKAKVVYIMVAILLLPMYIRRKGYCKVINFSDTLSSLMIASIAGFKFGYLSWIHCRPQAISASKSKWLYVKLLSFCEQIICICHSQKNELLALYPNLQKSKVNVVYNPIDIVSIRAKGQESIPSTRPYICMVSRIDERSKDFKTAIQAYASLPECIRSKYIMRIIGDGPDFSRVQKYIKENHMEEYIFLQGKDINPYKWMSNAELFLFSSRSEGLGVVILEALACGRIVIATDCPVGPREILVSKEECGLLVPVGDVHKMRDAIVYALDPMFPRHRYLKNAKERLMDFNHNMFKIKINYLFSLYE